MATALKRTEVATAEVETDLRAERLREGLRQLEAARADFIVTAKRFGKGAALWDQKGWEWVEPDWEEEPETWPPIARLLWLKVRLDLRDAEISMLYHLTAHPGWCPRCHPEEKLPPYCRAVECVEHFAEPPVIKALATRLGFRDEK